MKLESVGDVIATRELFLTNNPSNKIVVMMGKPQRLPDVLGDDHFCPIQIVGIGPETVKYAAGIDAFQCLELGLKMIGIELAYLNSKHSGRLRWEGDEHGDLGFPFPEAFQQ